MRPTLDVMRKTCSSLLILAATAAFGASHPRAESPMEWDASLLTSAYACTQDINRAQVITNAGNGATFRWSVADGIVVDGQGTPAIAFTPVDGGHVVVSAVIGFQSTFIARNATLPVIDPPTIIRQPQSVTAAPGTSVTL